MNIMRSFSFKILTFLGLFLILYSPRGFCQNSKITSDSIVRSGEIYPFIQLTATDTLELPINLEIELYVKAIRDLTIRDGYFYAETADAFYFDHDSIYVSKSNEEIYVGPYYVRLLYPEGDLKYIESPVYDGNYDDKYQWSRELIELNLPHKWDLRNYPFDQQKLQFVYRATEDSSVVRLYESKTFPPQMSDNFPYLLDGFVVEGISSRKNYFKSPYIIDSGKGERYRVFEELIFEVLVSRKGAFLYFKLFFGAILSFIISYLVFFIDNRLFETRITLSLGGIFGAVGNKYFVESSMPEIQVLTKADLINNLIIFLIIMNIFLVIAQQQKNLNVGILEDNRNAAIFMLLIFIVTNSIIILF